MCKKLSALLLCCAVLLSLCACGSTSAPTALSGTAASSAASGTSAPQAVTIAPDTVLLEQDGLRITAKELAEDSIWGLGVKLLIENDSAQNLGVQCNSLIVNNYMISNLFSCSVAAGKKATDTLYLSSSELGAAGIDTIADIAVSFHVFDDDSYHTLFDSEEIALPTSAHGTVEQPALDDGKELLNQDGIRIIGRYVDEDTFWGAGVLLFIENNSGKNITVQCDNMSVNGFMVTPYFSCNVNQGRMALEDITLMASELEENDIKAVEDIELTFRILDPGTYQTILETDPIAFSVTE